MLRVQRSLSVVVAVAASVVFSTASAHATTLYPRGDTLDVVSAGASTPMAGRTSSIRCTSSDLGAGRISAEGAALLTLSTTPRFEGCTEGWVLGLTPTITTTGRWILALTWGAPTELLLLIGARTIEVTVRSGTETICTASSAEGTLTGTWQNGFTTPVFVNSIASYRGTVTMRWSNEFCEGLYGNTFTIAGTAVAVRDATNERAVILVGP